MEEKLKKLLELMDAKFEYSQGHIFLHMKIAEMTFSYSYKLNIQAIAEKLQK